MTYKTKEQKDAELMAAITRQAAQRRAERTPLTTTTGEQLMTTTEVRLTLAQLQELDHAWVPTNQFGRKDTADECGMYCYDREPLALLAREQWRLLGYEVGPMGYYEEPGQGDWAGETLQTWTLDVSIGRRSAGRRSAKSVAAAENQA